MSFFKKRMCLSTFSHLRRSLATSTLYAAACIPMEWFLLYRKAIPCKAKKRQPPIGCPFKEKVFLLWGVVKTIYIMYWGVFTLIIVSPLPFKVCTNFTKVVPTFCILYIVPFSHFRKNFLFVFYSSVVSVTTSAPLWNNASNSSLPIFSFSKRRSADLWSTSLFS